MLDRCLFGVSSSCRCPYVTATSHRCNLRPIPPHIFKRMFSFSIHRSRQRDHASVEANDVITTITTLFDMHTTLLFGFNRACLWKRRYSFGGVEQEEENLVHMPCFVARSPKSQKAVPSVHHEGIDHTINSIWGAVSFIVVFLRNGVH